MGASGWLLEASSSSPGAHLASHPCVTKWLPYKHFFSCVGSAFQWCASSRPVVDMRGSLASQWHWAGSRLCATGVGRVEASGWLLEARTSEVENGEPQRRVSG